MFEENLAGFLPYLQLFGDAPWKLATLVIVIFSFAAWLLGFVLNTVARRITDSNHNKIDDRVIRYLRRPVVWSLFFLGLIYAAYTLGVGGSVLKIFQAVMVSIIIILWANFAASVVKMMLSVIVKRADEHSLIQYKTLPLFNNISAILIYSLAIYLLFLAWGIDMTAWLASVGVIGIAVGFAAKDTLANLFSGLFIMADAPYKIGDYVVLDDSLQSRGKVTHIGIRSTRLLTRDDVEITVPNSIMGNSQITNQSGGPHEKFRCRVEVSVAYGSDTEQVEKILLEEAAAELLVCLYPEPRVRFRRFGASGLEYELLFWITQPEFRGNALHHLNTKIYNAFKREGIEIPYNKQDVYIKSLPGAKEPAMTIHESTKKE